eukprot:scaffold43691_cov90-Phaeocystis_antarctica.AAC.2
MVQCAGAGRAAHAQVLLGQLAPLMRASEISAENERNKTRIARQQSKERRTAHSRAAVRADMQIFERALESYAVTVLMWLDGDPDPPPLAHAMQAAFSEMASVLKST